MRQVFILLLGSLLLTACRQQAKDPNGPFRGDLDIFVDSALKPIIEEEIEGFSLLYPDARIHPRYSGQAEVFNALLQDSVSLIFAAQALDTAQAAFFKSRQLFPDVFHIASDAVVLITSQANQDTLLSLPEMRNIFSGRWNNWRQVPGPFTGDRIDVVFDNRKSGLLPSIQVALGPDSLGARIFAMDSTEAAIAYVEEHPDALGVIGFNHISNLGQEQRKALEKRVRIVYLGPENAKIFYRPDQSNIATGDYPLSRKLYAISREAKWGLASSFLTYVNGDKGQRIFLKAGLVPANNPGREVIIRQ